jgi:hypothetical protein
MSVGKGLASRLRQRVIVQEANVEDNGRGGRRVKPGQAPWRNATNLIPAEILPLRGGEALSLGVQRSTQLYRVTMRIGLDFLYPWPITTAHRLVWVTDTNGGFGEIPLDIRTCPPSTDGRTIVMTCESTSGQK